MSIPMGRYLTLPDQTSSKSRDYYQIIADILGVEFRTKELLVSRYLSEHPEHAPFLCHRLYDLSKLTSNGVQIPSTSVVNGLRQQVEYLS